MPIVAVSGADEAGGAEARRAGADAFLAKPARADELAETLRRLIAEAARDAPVWLEAGDLRVHRRDRRLAAGSTEQALTPDEHRLLVALLEPPLQPRSIELLCEGLSDDRPVGPIRGRGRHRRDPPAPGSPRPDLESRRRCPLRVPDRLVTAVRRPLRLRTHAGIALGLIGLFASATWPRAPTS